MVNRPIEIDGVKYFKCKKCGEVKPLNKCYFHINTMFSTGFNSKCKSCVKEEVESKPKVKYITRAELEEENRKLNIKVASLEGEIKGLNYTIEKLHKEIEEQEAEGQGLFDEIEYRKRECKKLKEKVETLELWLDNKEKLNEEYRKQIDKYKRQYEHSMGEDDELIYEGLYD